VTGESPIVDTQSIRRQTTLDHELLTSAPTARSWAATAVLIPGIVTQAGASADVQITPQMTVFGGMGGRGNEGRMQVDGLNTGAALNGGGVSTYVADISNAQEVVTTTSGGLGEAEVGGPTLSIVPRSGGNKMTGQTYLSGVSSGMVGSNYSDTLKNAGLSTPGSLVKQWDFAGGVGGPILKDRIWYYATARDEGQWRTIPGVFPNKNANDPAKWLYEPDTTRTAQGAESFQLFSTRFTVQASPRNKFNVHWDWQIPCNGAAVAGSSDGCRTQPNSSAVVGALGLGGLTATTSPETAQYLHLLVQNRQFTWSSPVTNKLLLEAGLGSYEARWGPNEAPGNLTRGLVRVTEQASRGFDTNGDGTVDVRSLANLAYRSANWAEDYDNPNTWRGAASYVTGSHSLKVGYIGGYLVEDIEPRQRSQSRLHLQQRRAQSGDAVVAGVQADGPREIHRGVRAGSVDDGPDDTAGSAAVRSRVELFARADDRPHQLPGDTAVVPEDAWRRRVQGHLASGRRGLRSVRKR
jgi:hypothetical protein